MINARMTPMNRARMPGRPAFLISSRLAPKAVDTMEKSRSMPPPITARPLNMATSDRPFSPPVARPPIRVLGS